MGCCCVKTLNLCNVPVCGVLEIQQAATEESGIVNNYTLVLDFFESEVTIRQQQTAGENIVFPVVDLNEHYQYTGKIYDSAGNLVTITVNGIDYDCIKFKTVQSLGVLTESDLEEDENTVVIEGVVGGDIVVTGTNETVEGIEDGSLVITSDAFIGHRLFVIRGSVPLPGIDPGDGSDYFTKNVNDNYLTLTSPLFTGELIRIETIP